MSKANNLTDFLTDIANTIRTKKGTSGTIDPQDFSSEISSISMAKELSFTYDSSTITINNWDNTYSGRLVFPIKSVYARGIKGITLKVVNGVPSTSSSTPSEDNTVGYSGSATNTINLTYVTAYSITSGNLVLTLNSSMGTSSSNARTVYLIP